MTPEDRQREQTACKEWWDDHDPGQLEGADYLSALSAWMERAKREPTEGEWKRRAEMLRAKLGECQMHLEKAVQDGHKHRERAENAEKKMAKALEGMERAGWPCSLDQLPDAYVEMGHELVGARQRAEVADGALKRSIKGSVQLGLDLALQHVESQKGVWRGTETPPEVILDLLTKNLAALKEHVENHNLPEMKNG